jgi:hypothetical protein
MRTTVSIDDELLKQAKTVAVSTGRTLSAVVEDALRVSLLRQARAAERPPVSLPTFRGKGLQPGVDLDNNAALLDFMEESDDAPS